MPEPRPLLDKIWDAHVVARLDEGRDLVYVDLHLIHEVTSPQAFEGLRLAGRTVRRPDRTVGTIDHNVSTVRSGRRTVRPASRSPSKACVEVTSWMRCRST